MSKRFTFDDVQLACDLMRAETRTQKEISHRIGHGSTGWPVFRSLVKCNPDIARQRAGDDVVRMVEQLNADIDDGKVKVKREPRKPRNNAGPLTHEQYNRMASMRAQGSSWHVIADELGMSRPMLRKQRLAYEHQHGTNGVQNDGPVDVLPGLVVEEEDSAVRDDLLRAIHEELRSQTQLMERLVLAWEGCQS